MPSDDPTSSAAVKAGVEVFKTAYEDAIKPAAKELGKAGETLGRAINVALMPARGVVWSFEQIEDFVKVKVQEKLEQNKVAPDDVQVPDPDIAVPSIEALRYSKLKEEFANLLATSMDKKSAADAHPSFVELLKQITPDEAKILTAFESPIEGIPFITYRLENPEGGFNDVPSFVSKLTKAANVERSENIVSYIDNLQRLRLIHIPIGQAKNDEETYKDLEALPSEFDIIAERIEHTLQKLRGVVHLTTYGEQFKTVCLE